MELKLKNNENRIVTLGSNIRLSMGGGEEDKLFDQATRTKSIRCSFSFPPFFGYSKYVGAMLELEYYE